MVETSVIIKDAKYDRVAYLKLRNNSVVFDDSDCEYGPTIFDLNILEKAIKEHKKKLKV